MRVSKLLFKLPTLRRFSQSAYNLSLFLPAMIFFPVHIHNLFRPSVAVKTFPGAHVCTQSKVCCLTWRCPFEWIRLKWLNENCSLPVLTRLQVSKFYRLWKFQSYKGITFQNKSIVLIFRVLSFIFNVMPHFYLDNLVSWWYVYVLWPGKYQDIVPW